VNLRLALLFLISVSGAGSPATLGATPAPPAPEGLWQGTLQSVLRIVVHVDRGPGGALKASLDSPDQGAMGLAIDTVDFAADSIRFEMRRLQADYLGRMNAAGDSIVGRWRQGTTYLPLLLVRGGQAPALARRPQEPARPLPYDTVAVVFDNTKAGIKLAGTLTLPRGTGPFPCALLITGSGPEDRDEAVFGHRPFLVLADHLTRNGIAVLRVDDRGVGGSTGRFSQATSEDFADDVIAGVEFLKTRAEVDARRIGLVGHSEGGLIAPIVASRSKDVAFIVLMAGPGIPGDSTLMLQSAAIRRSIGVGEGSIGREMILNRRLYSLIKAGDSLGVVRAARELVRLQIAGLPEDQRRAVGDPDSLAAAAIRPLSMPWMKYFIRYDPRPTLRRVRCPVLAINGGKDLQVLPKENLAAIETALRAGGLRDVTVKELPGLNHLFQTCATCTMGEYSQLEETMAPVALAEMSSWILARTTTKR
jgi:pimeloyl-ACP methyl ester carboxylesterase